MIQKLTVWGFLVLGLGATKSYGDESTIPSQGPDQWTDSSNTGDDSNTWSDDEAADRETWQAFCRRYDRAPRICDAQPGCRYSWRLGVCTGGGGGAPGGGPGGFPGGGPGGGPGGFRSWVCTAVDQGFEEHRQGHQGTGWTRVAAMNAAARTCEAYHGSCRVTQCWER